jgi:hypothetical protein
MNSAEYDEIIRTATVDLNAALEHVSRALEANMTHPTNAISYVRNAQASLIQAIEHMREAAVKKCVTCGGTGWLVGDVVHPHIVRCDRCQRFESDSQAAEYVADLASREPDNASVKKLKTLRMEIRRKPGRRKSVIVCHRCGKQMGARDFRAHEPKCPSRPSAKREPENTSIQAGR